LIDFGDEAVGAGADSGGQKSAGDFGMKGRSLFAASTSLRLALCDQLLNVGLHGDDHVAIGHEVGAVE